MSQDFNGTTSTIGFIGASSGQVNAWTFNTPQPFSVCAWIQPDSLGENSSGRIVCCENAGGAGTGLWSMNIQAPSSFRFFIDYTNPGNVVSVAANATIDTSGVWQHVAATWNGGAATNTANLKLYWNANEVSYASRLTSGGTYISNTHQALVVGNVGNAVATWDGRIAHVHIFRKELSQGEIRQVMAHPASFANLGSTSSVGTSGLIGYWDLGRCMGPNASDLSGNLRAGTITAVVRGSNEPPVNETFVVGYPMPLGACC